MVVFPALMAACFAMPADGLATDAAPGIFDPVAARAEHLTPPEERPLSKKEEWLREKTLRPDFRISESELERAANPSRREKAARAKQIAADVNRLTGADVTSISRANEPKGARIRKIVMTASGRLIFTS